MQQPREACDLTTTVLIVQMNSDHTNTTSTIWEILWLEGEVKTYRPRPPGSTGGVPSSWNWEAAIPALAFLKLRSFLIIIGDAVYTDGAVEK